MAETVTRADLWRVARSRRMLGLLAVLLAAAVVCGLLGAWQLDRARERGAAAREQRQAELVAADPVPLVDVLAPQTSFSGDLVGRKVSVTGAYEPGQVLVTGRAHDETPGSLVLTPLRVSTASGDAVLPVVRGWVPAGAAVPAPPEDPVELVGYLQAGESTGTGLAETIFGTTTDAISPAELLHVWDGPIWTGYLVLASSDPAQAPGPVLLDPPTPTDTGPNLQNLLYAGEWFVFGGFAVFIWWRSVLDEARGRRRLTEPTEPTAPAAPAA